MKIFKYNTNSQRIIILRAYLSEFSFLLISLSEIDATPPSSLPEFSSILYKEGGI